MPERLLQIVVRTPYDTILEVKARSLRVPTETGQVGLRPGAEPMVLAIEPGLVLLSLPERDRYVGTAGGLLRGGRSTVLLLTPLAVAGEDADSVRAELERALSTPDEELEARATLGQLETSLLRQLRRETEDRLRSRGSAP